MNPAFFDSRHAMWETLTRSQSFLNTVEDICLEVKHCILIGGKIITCGNGGSAAEAAHLASEFTGKYASGKKSLPAICLNADVSALTCIANDFSYPEIFSRQYEVLVQPKDLLIVLSTSGNSPNIQNVLKSASRLHHRSIALLGKHGGACKGLASRELIIPSQDTGIIQEVHLAIIHAICEHLEDLRSK